MDGHDAEVVNSGSESGNRASFFSDSNRLSTSAHMAENRSQQLRTGLAISSTMPAQGGDASGDIATPDPLNPNESKGFQHNEGGGTRLASHSLQPTAGTAETSVIFQPAASVLHNGSAGLEGFNAMGEKGRPARAGLCVRVDGSAWSRPLDIAVQGAGGPFQVGVGFPSSLLAWV